MPWVIGVDVGGTFTDLYAYDSETLRYRVHKLASTPAEPHRAILEGLSELCGTIGIRIDSVNRLEHGTTVATNTLIQKRGARVALVTTRNFRDLLEIQRQVRPHMYSFQQDYHAPLVPRELRLEVAERVTASGEVRVPLAITEVDEVIDRLRNSGVEAVAVCFLFSYLRPDHERTVRDRIATALPELFVSISSAVRPEFREFERLSTTVLNAYLQPVVTRYLDRLEKDLSSVGPKTAIGINSSRGGLMSVERARHFPIRTALSGPAAGVMGAMHVARLANRPNLITLDMGGTSADVCLIRDYVAGVAFSRTVAGFPVRLPTIDIETIGAGGGSIAWFERDGGLKVGPTSAGAVPGPACYGLGGEAATVTDANLLLGRLSSAGLVGGRMALDPAAARHALRAVAEQLGFSVERAAHGVLAIAVSNMVRSLRSVSVERGHDPRGFTLFAFGGAGPLHATDVARNLDIHEILVPPAPGILCAQGLVASDLVEDFVRTDRIRLEAGNEPRLRAHLAFLADQAEQWFAAEEVAPTDRFVEISFDMRYVGQNFELSVPIGSLEMPSIEALHAEFFTAHERSYGYFNSADPVEIVNMRMAARGRLKFIEPPVLDQTASGAAQAVGERPVWFSPDKPYLARRYARDELLPGHEIVGPAVIEQLDATTLVFPGDRAAVDGFGNLLIEVSR
jgi:N-methylhydantoinase A